MHGNVWEWCRDRYTEKLTGGRDPDVKPDELKRYFRVFRGGSWDFDAACCRSGYRGRGLPNERFSQLGFRVALSSVQPVK
jgi:formylglycine-generating enzyme required for sulfatase activity